MKLIKIAGAVLNQTPFDWSNNMANIIKAIEQARKESVTILCLPELCLTGYGCEDMFHSLSFLDKSEQLLLKLLPYTKGMIVSVGLPIYYKKSIFNTACLIADGKILGFLAIDFHGSMCRTHFYNELPQIRLHHYYLNLR